MTIKDNRISIKGVLALNWMAFFTSGATLICCAIPALLVSLGLGVVLAGLVSNFPQLLWVSEHKFWVFGLAGTLLALASLMQWYAANLPCPVELNLAKACVKARKISKIIHLVSWFIFLIGAWFAFVAPIL